MEQSTNGGCKTKFITFVSPVNGNEIIDSFYLARKLLRLQWVQIYLIWSIHLFKKHNRNRNIQLELKERRTV